MRRRLKKKQYLALVALERGITTPGGIAKAVYGKAPTDKDARRRAVKMKYYVRAVANLRPRT